jgi:DNA-binding response OmpR family regulator
LNGGNLTKSREKRGLRILVVESDPGISELLTDLLTVPGRDAVSVSNSSKALDLLAERHFDLMLVAYSLSRLDRGLGQPHSGDQSLPKSDGLTLARKARENQPGLKIIILTTSDEEALSAATGRGIVDAIIRKPFSLTEVEETVATLFPV